jgi:hypothetical protein
MQTTEAEIQELASRVAAILRVNSKGVGELPVADSLTGVLSLPTLRFNGGIAEVVIVPVNLLQQIATDSIEASIAAANAATGNANTATAKANTAAVKADTATSNATTAMGAVNGAIAASNVAANEAKSAAGLALAKLQELEGFTELIAQDLSLSPTRIELQYVARITLGNPYVQFVAAQLFPKYLPQNILFLCADGESLDIDPTTGKLTVKKTGKTRFHIIPMGNTSLRKTI